MTPFETFCQFLLAAFAVMEFVILCTAIRTYFVIIKEITCR